MQLCCLRLEGSFLLTGELCAYNYVFEPLLAAGALLLSKSWSFLLAVGLCVSA